MSTQETPMIFLNIGWMNNYQGQSEKDPLLSNFKYVQEHSTGYEEYNFLPDAKNNVFGYAPLQSNINIDNLGADTNDNFIDNVTVVFFSKHPYESGARIVGLYTKAKVFREIKTDRELEYYATTDASNAICLPAYQRTILVPYSKKIKGGYGQTPLWYANGKSKEIKQFRQDVLTFIQDYQTSMDIESIIEKHNTETLINKQDIEKIAINMTSQFYTNRGYKVVSTEKDNCGWDLCITKKKNEFFIEVKGTAKHHISFNLTPNEYKKLQEHHKKYKIAVVTKALTKSPVLEVFDIKAVKINKKMVYCGIKKDKICFYLGEITQVSASPILSFLNED